MSNGLKMNACLEIAFIWKYVGNLKEKEEIISNAIKPLSIVDKTICDF